MADIPSEAQAAAVAVANLADHTPDGVYRGTQGFSPRALAAAQTSLSIGFLRYDLTPQTPNINGWPGIEIAKMPAASIDLLDWHFVLQLWDGNTPTLYVQTDLYPGLTSFSLDSQNDWQGDGNVVTGDYLLGGTRPKQWTVDDTIRVCVGTSNSPDENPQSTQGIVTVIVRTLPTPPALT